MPTKSAQRGFMVNEVDSRSSTSDGSPDEFQAQEGVVQLFDSVKMYVFMFCVLALIAVPKVYQLTTGPAPASTAGFTINNVVLALITIYLAVYLAGLLRKLSSRIEQAAVVLVEVACILWLANWLTTFGITWAEIPHSRLLEATVHCAITVLAGVRTFQIARHRRHTQAA
jgi:hypothetical protein